MKPLPTHQRVKALLDYDPATGVFTWRETVRGRNTVAGAVAGCVSQKTGYRSVGIDGGKQRANRLAWFWMTGQWPERLVDHENGVKNDDRWDNLRHATKGQNNSNSRLKSNNRSGYKGVVYRKSMGKWTAQITVKRMHKHLGTFDTPEAAHAAYVSAANRDHGEFARPA